MIKRVIFISKPSQLSLSKSQLSIEQEGEINFVPIEDVGVLILDNPTITISHPLLARLATEGVVTVTSDEKHSPIGLHLPLYNHSTPSLFYQDQLDIQEPTRKQIWQKIIKAKLRGQAIVLAQSGKNADFLYSLSEQVRSGDVENMEAQGARYYWKELFGSDFDRDRYGHTANSALNYGYSLIRSALARAVVGAGLLPMIGIWHANRYNPFNLVDDLIEPLRPMVDLFVYNLSLLEEFTPLSSSTKQNLATLLTRELVWKGSKYDLFIALTYYVASFRDGLKGSGLFIIPEIPELTDAR